MKSDRIFLFSCLRFRLIVSATALLIPGFSVPSSGQIQITRQDVHHDVSPTLREMAGSGKAAIKPMELPPREAEPLRLVPLPDGFKPATEPDPAVQGMTPAPQALFPAVINSFDGIGQGIGGFNVQTAPPDTSGAAGLTQYVQWANFSFAVFDKTSAAIIFGPVAGKTLWAGFGGDCETSNDGDPIVVYDKLADRWVLSQFVVHGGVGPFFQCVAVSTTPDATGPYNRYSFQYSTLNDYPRMGAWPDAYYVTFNMFTSSPPGFAGADACAYERNAMLSGGPARQICFQQGSLVGGLLPSDLDGHTAPPAGSPNFLMNFGINSLNLFKFHVDFATPENSTFTGPTVIPVADFTPLCGGSAACVPQLGDPTRLDSLADRLMNRLTYRNFGTQESLVVNHSVAAGAGGGGRWYEIQNPNGTPIVAQQSTFAPDNSFRWMGSIAMDGQGDIAMGYSISSATMFPSIAFTGRLAGDPASTMGAESTIIAGGGAQNNSLSRWGESSSMQTDPADDCTFWYTTEYLKATGSFNWNTRIANFKFPGCGSQDLSVTISHAGNFVQGQTGAAYIVTVSNFGGRPTDGTTVTVTDTLPAKLTATSASGSGWNCALGPIVSCTRQEVLASGGVYPPITLTVRVAADAPGSVTNSVTVEGGGQTNIFNDTATDPTTIKPLNTAGPLPSDLVISKSHTGNFHQSSSASYLLTVTNQGLGPTIGAVTVTDILPAGLTNGFIPSGSGWTCDNQALSCTRSDALAPGMSYPSLFLSADVTANAPALVINTATVTGGGDVTPGNNTATDPTTIIPSPDFTIAMSHAPDPLIVGGAGVYTITVSNSGHAANLPSDFPINVTDFLPSNLKLMAVSGMGWNCQANGFAVCIRSDALAAGSSYPPISLTVSVLGGGPLLLNTAMVNGGGEFNTSNDSARDIANVLSPSLTISKSHTGNFTVGQPGTYKITVGNNGAAPTLGLVTMTDSLPQGLTATSMSGTGWGCTLLPPACVRSDSLAAGGSYPPVSLIVAIGNVSSPTVTNQASVSGGADPNPPAIAGDPTTIIAPVLAIAKSHAGNFTVGQAGVYTITVSNTGPVATAGLITVTDVLPAGLTPAAVTGTGWTCSAPPANPVVCTRSDALPASAGYPSITLTVNVLASASSVTNVASVTGGGDGALHSISDVTNVSAPVLSIGKSHAGVFTVGQTGIYTITVGNTGTSSTLGTVTVTDPMPVGFTATAVSGAGWSCPGLPATMLTCTRADALAAGASYPALSVAVSVGASGSATTNTATVGGGGDPVFHSASDPTMIITPSLAITKTHTGNFNQGPAGGLYTITVSNVGVGATAGTVTVSDFMPTGLTLASATGVGWSCTGTTAVNCTRADSLAPNAAYPSLLLTVNVGNTGPFPVINNASASGGGDAFGRTSIGDVAIVNLPSLSIVSSHTPEPMTTGLPVTYTIAVGNVGTAATQGAVTVTDSFPSFLTLTSVTGAGWSCSGIALLTCTRSDSLAPGGNYPPIIVNINVSSSARNFVNTAIISGGNDPLIHSSLDVATVNLPDLSIAMSHNADFTPGIPGIYTITVGNAGTITPQDGAILVTDAPPPGLTPIAGSGTGWTCSIVNSNINSPEMDCTHPAAGFAPGTSLPSISLQVNASVDAPTVVTNSASVAGISDSNPANNTVADITQITGSRFVPVTPCRVADTRNPAGSFGGPFLSANTVRGFTLPASACNVPAAAQAYSLNFTVVPHGQLGFLTVFPCGQTPPLASLLNSIDGRVKAGAAIVPAGSNHDVCAFPSNNTALVIDINGYFVPAADPTGLAFYPVTPCRLIDTRLANGPLGGPSMVAAAARTFPILSSPCAVPAVAQSYSLNYTVVPTGPLSFLTTWPAGQTQPLVSTLNAPTGAITANAAIVPAGTNGDISVFVTDKTDLVVDIDGYFAPPGPGGLSLYTATPCRVRDTRLPSGTPPFNGQLDVVMSNSACTIRSSAQSYVLNATVVPPGPLGFLTLWPQGGPQPLVSTLNTLDGTITSNMAIVPTTNGAISAFVSNPSHLVLDISGFFAP